MTIITNLSFENESLTFVKIRESVLDLTRKLREKIVHEVGEQNDGEKSQFDLKQR